MANKKLKFSKKRFLAALIVILLVKNNEYKIFNNFSEIFNNSCETTSEKYIDFMIAKISEINPTLDSKTVFAIAKNNFELSNKSEFVDPILLMSIQKHESHFKIESKSGKGARNINQIMPKTAKSIVKNKLLKKWNEDYLTDPLKNTELAVFLINSLFKRGFNEEQVLSSYNCCWTGGNKWLESRQTLPRETLNYVRQVMKSYKEYRAEFEQKQLALN